MNRPVSKFEVTPPALQTVLALPDTLPARPLVDPLAAYLATLAPRAKRSSRSVWPPSLA